MKMFLSLTIIMISFFMMFLYHPLSMGLMILTQTLLMCLISGMIIKTYWFSYILFLTFLGGLLVMFIYVSSIASNEMFKPSLNMIIYFFTFIMIMKILFNNNNLNWLNLTNNNNDMNNLYNYFLFFNNENKINLSKLYNKQTYLMMMMMITYLFITLIAIVKITNIFYGPIRSSSN